MIRSPRRRSRPVTTLGREAKSGERHLPWRSGHRLQPLLAAALLLLPTGALQAQGDQPPIDAAAALADLDRLEKANRDAGDQFRQKAVQTLRQGAAGGSAGARLYEEAVAGTGQADMSDWKKNNADLLRDKTFQEAVQMHLRYLLLSLERGSSDDPARGAEPSLAYARDLARWQTDKNNRPAPAPARELLAKPAAEGPFARWLRLDPFLPPRNEWEPAAGNLAGILEKNVRGPWRTAADPRIDTAWQLELEAGVALADADRTDRAIEEFNTRTAPGLLFRRALDQVATGQPNRAAADILEVARRHPSHPDFPQWAAKLREMLEKNQKSAQP
jgi:hypothetical protein